MSYPTVQLSEVATFANGGTPSRKRPEFYEGTIPWITGADIVASGATVTAARSHITEEAVGRSATCVVDPGTVLLVTRTSVGKVGIAGVPLAINQDITALRPDPERLDRDYLVRALQRAVHHFESRAQGATIQGVNREVVATAEIPLPPIEEQRRIAAVLDAADELRAKRRETLAKLDTLTQAIFIDMFGDPPHLLDAWPISELQALVAEGTSVTYGIVQAGDEYPEGVPYIRTGDIVDGRIATEGLRHTNPEIAARFERSEVRAGDLVMSIRATVGTAARVPPQLDGANLTQGTARIAPGEKVDAVYLLEYLRSPAAQRWITRQVKGATFREITLGRLRELPVPVPPRALQRRFAYRVAAIEGAVDSATASAEALLHLFGSLQQRAFRGEL